MKNFYLGQLDHSDPLYTILFSQVYQDVKEPRFHVNMISLKKVYKYTEEKTQSTLVGKFFRLNDTKEDRVLRIKGEYDNIRTIRGYGFDTFPYYVVRPISREEKIGLAVIEEFVKGKDLDHYFIKAIYEGEGRQLKDRLLRLASFLHTLHKRTETKNAVDLDLINAYFHKILNKLGKQTVISDYEKKAYIKLIDKWLNRSLLQEAKNVIVHGDATPTNFLFTENGDVVAIDLERMKNGDLLIDVGMVCGELKHAFMWRTGNPYKAELFISHFLRSYTGHFSNDEEAFREISLRNPFYMAMTELRIARNNYLDWNYRKMLAHEALECLKWGLKLR